MNGESPYDSPAVPEARSLFWPRLLFMFKWFFLFLVILIIGIGTCSVVMFKGYAEHDKKMKPFVSEAFHELVKWDYSLIKPYISSALLEQVPEADFVKITRSYRKLGKLQSISDISQGSCKSHNSTNGSFTRCDYSVSATFSTGDAITLIGVVTEGDGYKIMQINIQSEVFL